MGTRRSSLPKLFGALAFIAALFWNAQGYCYELKWADGAGWVKWCEDSPPNLVIDSASMPLGGNFAKAFQEAAQDWSKGPANFKYSTSFGSLKWPGYSLDDEINSVAMTYSLNPDLDGAPAISYKTWYLDTACIISSDILFSQGVNWSTAKSVASLIPYQPNGRSFHNTAYHELGHTLGLAHVNYKMSIMGSDALHLSTNGDTALPFVGADSTLGAVHLYGYSKASLNSTRDYVALHFTFDPSATTGEYAQLRWNNIKDKISKKVLPAILKDPTKGKALSSGTGGGEPAYYVYPGQQVLAEFSFETMSTELSYKVPIKGYFSYDDNIDYTDNEIASAVLSCPDSSCVDTLDMPFVIPEEIDFKGLGSIFAYLGAVANPEGTLLTYNAPVEEYNFANNGTYLPLQVIEPPLHTTYYHEGPIVNSSGGKIINYRDPVYLPYDENNQPIPSNIRFTFFITDPNLRQNWSGKAVYYKGKEKKLTTKPFVLIKGSNNNVILPEVTSGNGFLGNRILFYFQKTGGPSFATVFYIEKLNTKYDALPVSPPKPSKIILTSVKSWGKKVEAKVGFVAKNGGYSSSVATGFAISPYNCYTRFFVTNLGDTKALNPLITEESSPLPYGALVTADTSIEAQAGAYLAGAQTICPNGKKSAIVFFPKYLALNPKNNQCNDNSTEPLKLDNVSLGENSISATVISDKCNDDVRLEVKWIKQKCPTIFNSKGGYTTETYHTSWLPTQEGGVDITYPLGALAGFTKAYLSVRGASQSGQTTPWKSLGSIDGYCPSGAASNPKKWGKSPYSKFQDKSGWPKGGYFKYMPYGNPAKTPQNQYYNKYYKKGGLPQS